MVQRQTSLMTLAQLDPTYGPPTAASASVTERPDVSHISNDGHVLPTIVPATAYVHVKEPEEEEEAGGHDSPNWSRSKSFTILFGCTVLYSIIAEVLVDTVDGVMENLTVDEKFLGLTLFALVSAFSLFYSMMVDSHAHVYNRYPISPSL